MNKVDSIFPVDTPMWQIPYHMGENRNTLEQVDDFTEAVIEFINLLNIQGVISANEEIIFRMKVFRFQEREKIRIATKMISGL